MKRNTFAMHSALSFATPHAKRQKPAFADFCLFSIPPIANMPPACLLAGKTLCILLRLQLIYSSNPALYLTKKGAVKKQSQKLTVSLNSRLTVSFFNYLLLVDNILLFLGAQTAPVEKNLSSGVLFHLFIRPLFALPFASDGIYAG